MEATCKYHPRISEVRVPKQTRTTCKFFRSLHLGLCSQLKDGVRDYARYEGSTVNLKILYNRGDIWRIVADHRTLGYKPTQRTA